MWQQEHDDSIQDTSAAIYLLFAVAVTSDHFDVEKICLLLAPRNKKPEQYNKTNQKQT